MATFDEILRLRRYVAEPDETDYTDEVLSDIIDAFDTLDAAAVEIWDLKAASVAGLVDISEGGSSRKNSDLLKNAQMMRDLFQNRVNSAIVTSRGTRITRLTR